MSTTPTLLPESDWVCPSLIIANENTTATFTIKDVLNYHGYDAVGGAVLGFRLLQKALSYFSQNNRVPIERRKISLITAFPGLGARDCFELITRMATENRITVDTELDCPAQPGIFGRFYFEFHYQDDSIKLAPIEGYPGETFISIGKASKQPSATPEIQAQWIQAKYNLANTLLGAHYDDVIRVL